MEPARIQMPKRALKASAVISLVMLAISAAAALWWRWWFEVAWIRPSVYVGRSPEYVASLRQDQKLGFWGVAIVAAWCAFQLLYTAIYRKRTAVVLDERGIRVEGVRSAGPPVGWEELREVLTDDKSSVYALLAPDHRLNIPPWAGKEVFAELQRRVPLRLEKKTWSTRQYVREVAG